MAARKLNHLILVTIVVNGMAIALLAVALGTNAWFVGEFTDVSSINGELNYGLFKGSKTLTLLNSGTARPNDIILTCMGNKCMFSCGTSKNRKDDLDNIIKNDTERDFCYCQGDSCSVPSPTIPRPSSGIEKKFINFALLIMTIIMIAFGAIFSITSGAMALYNTYRAPIHPVLSVFGLYIWNAGAAISILLAMIIWTAVHATTLTKNPAISQTLAAGPYKIEKSNLGYSFWLLLPAIVLSLSNLVILKIRAWKIVRMEEKHVKVMNETLDNGDILLF